MLIINNQSLGKISRIILDSGFVRLMFFVQQPYYLSKKYKDYKIPEINYLTTLAVWLIEK